MQNRPEWTLVEQGCYCFSIITVPLYDALGEDTCAYVIDKTGLSVVVVDSDARLSGLLNTRPRRLEKIVCTHHPAPDLLKRAADLAVTVVGFAEMEKEGGKAQIAEKPPRPEDTATICFTAGTGDTPRGIVLTHANVTSSVHALLLQLDSCAPNSGDVLMSYLPLAHMLERICEAVLFSQGGSVGYWSGDLHDLPSDLSALRPTVVPMVPRQLNRLKDRAVAWAAGSGLRRRLLKWALSAKQAEVDRSIVRNDSIWDRLVLRPTRASLGGRVRLVVVGSAPTAPAVLNFARCALGCTVLEGYGQTECSGACTLTVPGDMRPGQVGPPLACCDVKLVDVPDMGYYTVCGEGEVCIRGSNVFKGYFGDPARTDEVLDKQGWLHTGDIGQWTKHGTLRIIDRRKHMFKLAQGEYVSPERVEAVYLRSRYISQLLVHGDSLKSCVVAVVVPEVAELKAWAATTGLRGTLSVLCQAQAVKDMILADMDRLATEARLKGFEQVKDIYLHPDRFSAQNSLLTAGQKPRRPEMRRYFKPQLDDLYAKLR
ncbi:long-chain-fatty-acid--CoA ligase 1-like [Amphibalanus amphitrite]|uniref:long-chain-fatty-acid--CoA ligase 1-like n=1 Tax=Amphibalanus amphitrite TaxID=1232801 RepID=UPI001C8FA87D|nr:long-chain-fatty-acid--CoA ligase 1-like [Amphibalanus amphitrite]